MTGHLSGVMGEEQKYLLRKEMSQMSYAHLTDFRGRET
jgi:hypothetical protein